MTRVIGRRLNINYWFSRLRLARRTVSTVSIPARLLTRASRLRYRVNNAVVRRRLLSPVHSCSRTRGVTTSGRRRALSVLVTDVCRFWRGRATGRCMHRRRHLPPWAVAARATSLRICQTILYLCMLDPIQNHALRLCLGAFRTSPCSSLSVEADELPLNLRREKLSLQYALRLSSNYQNPAYNVVFNTNFGRFFLEQTESDSST